MSRSFILLLLVATIGVGLMEAVPLCPPNQVWRECGMTCQPRCNTSPPYICNAMCREGCGCKDGYLLNSNDDCVPPSQC